GYQCMSGYPRRALAGQGGYPSIGAVLTKLNKPINRAVPQAIGLAANTQHMEWSEAGAAGYLGPACAPFRPNAISSGGQQTSVLKLNGLTLDRLQDRKKMLERLDATRRDLDSMEIQARDSSTETAFDMLTSSRLADALDVS